MSALNRPLDRSEKTEAAQANVDGPECSSCVMASETCRTYDALAECQTSVPAHQIWDCGAFANADVNSLPPGADGPDRQGCMINQPVKDPVGTGCGHGDAPARGTIDDIEVIDGPSRAACHRQGVPPSPHPQTPVGAPLPAAGRVHTVIHHRTGRHQQTCRAFRLSCNMAGQAKNLRRGFPS